MIVQRRCTSCCSSVEIIPLQAERHSGNRQRLFGLPPESVFSFRPECCSASQRNGVQFQTGIAFTFDRIPHVYSYQDAEVSDELLSFGQTLLDEANDWAKQIDSKATGVLGWATAIVAFLFTQLTKTNGMVNLSLGVASGSFAMLAVRRAYKALQARKGWLWPSDRDWFEETAFGSADELKRFHIRSLHQTRRARMEIDQLKSNHLWRAEKWLVVAAVLLVAGIVVQLLSASYPVALGILRERIRMRLSGL